MIKVGDTIKFTEDALNRMDELSRQSYKRMHFKVENIDPMSKMLIARWQNQIYGLPMQDIEKVK